MRMYTVNNFYLSSIQQGIQSLHSVVDLMVKMIENNASSSVLDWAKNHKTVIALRGGNSAALEQLERSLTELSKITAIDFAVFREDEDSLNGAITSIAILHTGENMPLWLINYLSSLPLAN